jgi:hypothetical protein
MYDQPTEKAIRGLRTSLLCAVILLGSITSLTLHVIPVSASTELVQLVEEGVNY